MKGNGRHWSEGHSVIQSPIHPSCIYNDKTPKTSVLKFLQYVGIIKKNQRFVARRLRKIPRGTQVFFVTDQLLSQIESQCATENK